MALYDCFLRHMFIREAIPINNLLLTRVDIDRCGPEGPAAGAKRPHAAQGSEGERSETVVLEAADSADNKTRD